MIETFFKQKSGSWWRVRRASEAFPDVPARAGERVGLPDRHVPGQHGQDFGLSGRTLWSLFAPPPADARRGLMW